MANASSKRIAAANQAALQGLARNLVLINGLALAVRAMKARLGIRPFVPPTLPLALHIIGFAASIFIWRWFVTIGAPRRDASGGVKVGEDLTSKGVIELAWDTVYMTWVCTLGSALLGNWVWWLYLLVPGFGAYKAFGVLQPFLAMFLPGIFGPRQPKEAGAAGAGAQQADAQPGESKRQAKLKARMERGDKRVQQQQIRRG